MFSKKMVEIEFCDTLEKKVRGLQHREFLEENRILVFSNIGHNQYFHMQNVRFPIDIASLDENGKILDIKQIEPQTGLYLTPIGTTDVIEASKGFFGKRSIKIGDTFEHLIEQELET